MYQVTRVEYRDVCSTLARRPWLTDVGSFNRMPAPAVEVSMVEFWRQRLSFAPEYIEVRQVHLDGPAGPLYRVFLYWYRDRAYALVFGAGDQADVPKRAYRVGCRHQDREMTRDEYWRHGVYYAGAQQRLYVCTRCGRVSDVDSSG